MNNIANNMANNIAWPPHLHPVAGIGEDDTESETGFLVVEVIDNGYFDGLGRLPI